MLCRVQIFRPAQPRKLLAQSRQRQAYNVEVAAFDPRNIPPRAPLNRIRAGLIERLAGCQITRDLLLGNRRKVYVWLRRSASGRRTSVTPVSTECVRPESFASIWRASSLVRGLPNTCPSSTTSVSAAITMAGPTARAETSSALASASLCTSSAGDSPAIGVSSTAEDSTVKDIPASCRISARRTEAEARISFMPKCCQHNTRHVAGHGLTAEAGKYNLHRIHDAPFKPHSPASAAHCSFGIFVCLALLVS